MCIRNRLKSWLAKKFEHMLKNHWLQWELNLCPHTCFLDWGLIKILKRIKRLPPFRKCCKTVIAESIFCHNYTDFHHYPPHLTSNFHKEDKINLLSLSLLLLSPWNSMPGEVKLFLAAKRRGATNSALSIRAAIISNVMNVEDGRMVKWMVPEQSPWDN